MSELNLAMRADDQHTLELTLEDLGKIVNGEPVMVRNLLITRGAEKNKPPKGLVPIHLRLIIANKQRLVEVEAAIKRYVDVNKPVPVTWAVELNNLRVWLDMNDSPEGKQE